MLFTHWAAASNAAHLHLVDIHVPGSLPEALVGHGSGLGAVTITRSDICRADDAAHAVVSCCGGPHSGIIHAAGLLQVRSFSISQNLPFSNERPACSSFT